MIRPATTGGLIKGGIPTGRGYPPRKGVLGKLSASTCAHMSFPDKGRGVPPQKRGG